jgi:two-component system sensor histidine kinase TctE
MTVWLNSSIRRLLLALLIPGLGLVTTMEFWLTWRTASEAADAAYDRSLLGAVKSIDSSISTISGGLGVELPYRMLEFFELTAQGQVFYRIATEDGLVEIGSANLPEPPKPIVTGKPQFYNGHYLGQSVRVGIYSRELNPPLAGHNETQRVVIQVAETLDSRSDFLRSLALQALARDILLMAAATGLLFLAIGLAMRPLDRLTREVGARNPEDLAPIDAEKAPMEVRPLVQAINHHIARSFNQASARRRFIDDASHQLRTPLTTLVTQVTYAQREQDPKAQAETLQKIREQLDETIRQTNQMLALARADSTLPKRIRFDLVPLAEALVAKWWMSARDSGVDLGLEAATGGPLNLIGEPELLKEALSNLLHNAIRYSGPGSQVTLKIINFTDDTLQIVVADDGPGLPEDEMKHLGERFFRGKGGDLPGSGLGLAIVRKVVERHCGDLQFSPGPSGRGFIVTLSIPVGGMGVCRDNP